MAGKIGVLALQGAFAKHLSLLHKLEIPAIEVRYPEQLSDCCGLILPGGESTTMTRQIASMAMEEPLRHFAEESPLFGTCAGMILMSRAGILSLLDIVVDRNAYGRQADSFTTPLTFRGCTFPGFFIRAPRITAITSPDVKVVVSYENEAVCVQQGHHLAASFHPELAGNPILHRYFIELCYGDKRVMSQSLFSLT